MRARGGEGGGSPEMREGTGVEIGDGGERVVGLLRRSEGAGRSIVPRIRCFLVLLILLKVIGRLWG
jgi:hypothetical protein